MKTETKSCLLQPRLSRARVETEQDSQEADVPGFVPRPRQGKDSKANFAAPEVGIELEGPRRSPQRAAPQYGQQRGPDGGPSPGKPEHSVPEAALGCLLSHCVSTRGLTHTRALETGRSLAGSRILEGGGPSKPPFLSRAPAGPNPFVGSCASPCPPHPSRPRGSVSSGT